ncbi:MAG: fluoride efflux transporter CrcB [Planctomycetota bacterium]|nr:fluoride efflux transporter CrcB [Planctomycetota bacterium]
MQNLLLAGLGGCLGAAGRYAVGLLLHHPADHPSLPVGTLVVNVVGCLAIGAVLGWGEARDALGPGLRAFLVAGVLGGFTTFSAFGYDTLSLVRHGHLPMAGLNVLAQVGLGLLAVWGGFVAGRSF